MVNDCLTVWPTKLQPHDSVVEIKQVSRDIDIYFLRWGGVNHEYFLYYTICCQNALRKPAHNSETFLV
eukprot:snap_masked-scaffold_12-processed-gene-6.20-mRNA-1 protein AED:1.00 eAED:1.00 QI:0/0/0/0/1/1/2/0/67